MKINVRPSKLRRVFKAKQFGLDRNLGSGFVFLNGEGDKITRLWVVNWMLLFQFRVEGFDEEKKSFTYV